MIFAYLQAHWLEAIGTLLSIGYLYLSIKQNIALWIFGFISSALYVVIFFQSKFYADMSLQFYYLGISVYGFLYWCLGPKNQAKRELPIVFISKRQGIGLAAVTALAWIACYLLLRFCTDSPLPVGDAFTTALCITATWMLAKKMLENWLVFVVADGVSMALYFYKGLHITAVLYLIYTIMAVVGYRQWKAAADRPANL